ncbi:MAG: hypothetical protein Fues2KO_45500 [Fuerstiella sp.]
MSCVDRLTERLKEVLDGWPAEVRPAPEGSPWANTLRLRFDADRQRWILINAAGTEVFDHPHYLVAYPISQSICRLLLGDDGQPLRLHVKFPAVPNSAVVGSRSNRVAS